MASYETLDAELSGRSMVRVQYVLCFLELNLDPSPNIHGAGVMAEEVNTGA